ncbi:MAG: SdrD B-like domain-containing protein [Bacteroidota bacterium]
MKKCAYVLIVCAAMLVCINGAVECKEKSKAGGKKGDTQPLIQARHGNPSRQTQSIPVPYTFHFDTDPVAEGWSYGGDFDWSSTFSKLGGPYGGSGASMVTKAGPPGTSYSGSTISYVESPAFDLSSLSGTGGFISFYQSIITEPEWDRSWFEYSINGGAWNTLGRYNDPDGVYWYNSFLYNALSGTDGNTCLDIATWNALLPGYSLPQPGWSSKGDCSGNDIPTGPYGWIRVTLHLLPGSGILQNNIRFRYITFSDYADIPSGLDGWAFDEFAVTTTPPPPPSLNPAPTLTNTNTSQVCTGNSYDVILTGSNFIDGVTSADFGAGIGVSIIIDPSGHSLTAHITVSPSATTGLRDISVTNIGPGGGMAILANAIMVLGSSMVVNSPNGGETWWVGESHAITWTSGCGATDLKIEYSTDTGMDWLPVADHIAPGLGTYGWTIPNTPTTTALVRITDNVTGTLTDVSNAVFTIRLGKLNGTKFYDANNNHTRESDEQGLSNWTIHLTGDATMDTQTDANGNYSFSVPPGNYTITEENKTGWQQTAPLSGTYSINLLAGQDMGQLIFGNTGTASISGTVFDDRNNNGQFDGTDDGMWGWYVGLEETNGNSDRIMLTLQDGSYSFMNVPPGSYYVYEYQNTPWTLTSPPSDWYTITITGGENLTGKDFGNYNSQDIYGLSIHIYGDYSPNKTPCCNQPFTYQVVVQNKGTIATPYHDVLISLDKDLDYLGGSVPYDYKSKYSDGSIALWYWSSSINPGRQQTYTISVQPKCAVSPSPVISTFTEVFVNGGNTNVVNNLASSTVGVTCQTTSAASARQMASGSCAADGYLTKSDSITYMIRFANTGIDTVRTVILRDTLDSNIDTTNVQFVVGNPPCAFKRHGRELKFTFPHVNLPPQSASVYGSRGFVVFTAHPKPDVLVGAMIINTPWLYYDLNDPTQGSIQTNTITGTALPIASFTASADSVPFESPVNFTYTGGTASATYDWNFGSGASPATSTDQNPSGVTYSSSGSKAVTLQVTANGCASEYAARIISVAVGSNVAQGWKLVSVPVTVFNHHTSAMYPGTSGTAYSYQPETGYQATDTMANGLGYWLKFGSGGVVSQFGIPIAGDTFTVNEGWNLIGSVSTPVNYNTLTSDPPGIFASRLFGYNRGYYRTDSITPGLGYWLKTSDSGRIIVGAGSAAPKGTEQVASLSNLNQCVIQDARGYTQTLYFGTLKEADKGDYDLPPVPPKIIFDIRFATNRTLERVDSSRVNEIPILISGASYPVKVSWNVSPGNTSSASLKIGAEEISLAKNGTRMISNAQSSISLKLLSPTTKVLPTYFALNQNYPNPFNPTTSIRYALPVDAHVRLTIYDVLGQVVTTLIDKTVEAGYQTVEWNSTGVASGVYFYRIEATSSADPGKNFTNIKKMVLLR